MGKKFQNEVENFYVSFSDLLALLLIFFVYLFSMSTIDPVKFTESSESITEEFSEKKPATSAAFGKSSPYTSDPSKAEPLPEQPTQADVKKTIGQTVDALVAKIAPKENKEKDAAGAPVQAEKKQTAGDTSGEHSSKLIAENKEKDGAGEPATAGKTQTIGQTIDKLIGKVFSEDSGQKAAGGEPLTGRKPKDTDVSQTPAAPEDRSAQGMLAEKLAYYIKKEKLDGQASVYVEPRGVKVVLESPVLFESGSADLSPEGRRILMKLGPVFKEVTNPVVIEGHTDNVPINNSIYGTNWELSFQRTLSVMKFFVGQFKFTPNQLSGTGYGEYRPLVPNTSDANKAKNRRIEINILRDYETSTASPNQVALSVAAPPPSE